MSKRPDKTSARGAATGQYVSREVASKKPKTAETWHVSKGGEARTVHTSKTSANAIDKAVKKYSNALRRLAKK